MALHANSDIDAQKDWKYYFRRKCWRKKAYPTIKAAHREAKKIFKKSGIKSYAYHCNACQLVHLTKQESAKGKTI